MSALLLTSLGVVCPACDHYNPPGSQRCIGCGVALGDGPAPKGATSSPLPKAVPPAGLPQRTPPAAAPPPAEALPPGMRPTRTGPPVPGPTPVAPTPLSLTPHPPIAAPPPRPAPAQEPIPANELVRRPATPAAAAAAQQARFGINILAGYARGQRFRLAGAGCLIGRNKGAILFPEDVTVSSHHATLLVRDGRLFVRDEGSLSGVFVTIGVQETLFPSGFFGVGQRMFRYLGALAPAVALAPGAPTIYGAPAPTSQILYGVEEVLIGGRPGRTVVSAGPLLTVGQQHCDFAFPNEEGVAARHCELIPSPASASLRDLSGGLGTFVRIGAGLERPLSAGDRFRVGAQVLQVEAVG
ncbi:MAG TPA: FHA domain-containing protein [Myxococcaceae bacterium]|nr:FHA domain-containing protein [Myxococcaceae bacterium]